MHLRLPVVLAVMLALLAAAILAGCGGHSAQAPAPPGDGGPAGGDFVGATVCQACHRNAFAAWTTTAHSDALAAIADIGQGENPSCLPCHTVGFGEPSGYVSEQETPHLADVQCENCHGAGGNHVTNPAQSPMLVPLEAEVCGGCHQGFHHPTFEQWESSSHAEALVTLQNNSHARSSCLVCHSAEAILATGQEVVLQTVQVKAENAITCVACHAPHGSPHEAQLREPKSDICISCHTTGGTLPGSTPHHPQREMLLGLGGREANGAEAIGPNSDHSTIVLSRCVACHVYQEHPDDPTRENPVNTGHTFEPNVPTACQECHPGDTSIQFLNAAHAEINGLLDGLAPYFDSASPMFIDPSTLSGADLDRYNVAKFNRDLVSADASGGVHNRVYARHLLEVSESILSSL